MTDKELKRLSRAELLEMLIAQGTELEQIRAQLEDAEKKLADRTILLDRSGSIAEAALRLNGVFAAAEAAGQQYLDSIRSLSERQEAVCDQMEATSRERAGRMVAEAESRCAELEQETQAKCEAMLSKAKAEAQAYWSGIADRLDALCAEHAGLREQLSATGRKL